MTERYRKMEEVYAQVCTLFGENPKVVEPSDFFKTFINFIANYMVCTYWGLAKLWYDTDISGALGRLSEDDASTKTSFQKLT